MEDGALDFLAFVLVLGIVVSIGFGLVVNSSRETYADTLQGRYDKTMSLTQGEKIAESSLPGLTKAEVAMAVEVQDYRLPLPTKMTVGTNDPYYINGKHPANMKNAASTTWNALKDDPADTRYQFLFDYGDPEINLELTKAIVGEVKPETDEDINETYRLAKIVLSEHDGVFRINDSLKSKLEQASKRYMSTHNRDDLKVTVSKGDIIGHIEYGSNVKYDIRSGVNGKIRKEDIRINEGSNIYKNDIVAYIQFN